MMNVKACVLAVLLFAVAGVHANVYMHYPRGSNNRLDEDQNDRTTNNRLFNSQNNARGGSNKGSTSGEKYYVGSVLPLEWTNTHSCGVSTEANQANNDCNVIWQYMCEGTGDQLRDGATTAQIPVTGAVDEDATYGRHESQAYYEACVQTQRNLNLYTANQPMGGVASAGAPNGIRGASAISTHQLSGRNADGDLDKNASEDVANNGDTNLKDNTNTSGFECEEERDYYPYWRGSPWIDIVYFTNTPERCEAVVQESQNVKPRAGCHVGLTDAKKLTKGWIPSDEAACKAMAGATWKDVGQFTWDAAHDVLPPACVESMPQRDNHNGNTDGVSQGQIGGFPSTYNWTIPDIAGTHCAIRVRYNVSSSENGGAQMDPLTDPLYGAYGFASLNSIAPSIDATKNQNAPGQTGNVATKTKLDVWSQFGLTEADSAPTTRDYAMRDNAEVRPFASSIGGAKNPRFRMAINTKQFFRTFQDRTHTIGLGLPRPTGANDPPAEAVIYNVNFIGKRGNIVEAYPGVEYDFSPRRLYIRNGDYVHFQWTGSDKNNDNNDGQGTAGQDRHNAALLQDQQFQEGGRAQNMGSWGRPNSPRKGAWGRTYPARVYSDAADQSKHLLGWPFATVEKLIVEGITSSYVDMGAMQVKDEFCGEYYYVDTRNNNFTNRGEKGMIHCDFTATQTASMGYAGGHVYAGADFLKVYAGTLSKQHKVVFTAGPSHNEWESNWVNVEVYAADNAAHEFHVRDGKQSTVDLQMKYNPSPFTKPVLYKTIDGATVAHAAEFNHARGVMLAQVNNGGMHVIKYHVNVPLVLGLGMSSLFLLSAIVAGTVASCRKAAKAV